MQERVAFFRLRNKHFVASICAFVLATNALTAGLFWDTDFYVVVQKAPSGQYIDGWVVQGAPKNDNGVYIFTIYRTKIEKRIPVQGTVITKAGSKWEDASKMLSGEIRAADQSSKFKGF